MAETITNVSVGIVTGNRTKIDSATVKNGRIYFSKDTGELFYDWNGTRVQVCPQTTPNNATLSIKANGTDVSTFTANSSINRSIDISAGSNITISGTASTGKIVISGTADTKNTAGATVTDNSIYLVGPTATGSASAQTYANASVYMRGGKLYSDKKVVATESFVTGKGYQTAANVAAAINTSINALDSSVPVTSNQAVAGFEEVNGKITNVTKVTIPTVSYPVTSVAGKTGAVDLDDLTIGEKSGASGTATAKVVYDGSAAKTLYFNSAAASTTNVKFAVDTNGFVTGTVTDSGNTWRGVYTGGTSRVGTGTSTKAINYVGANGITVSYLAAGTGSGQSGSTNYFNVSVGHTNSITAGDVSATISGTTLTIPKISYDAQGHITTVTSGTVTTQDTKNTTGSSSSTGKLYIVGAGSQNSTGVTTYSNANVYTQNGSLYATGMYEGSKRVATQEYVDGLVANATHYKGTFNATNGKINGGSTTLTSVAEKVGDLYKCDTAGTYLSTAYEVGDSIYFIKDVAASTAPVATDITSIEGTVSVSVPSTVPTIGTSDTTLGTVEGVAIKAKIGSYLTRSNLNASLNALDASVLADSGKYVAGFEEVDGLIKNVTYGTLPAVPTTPNGFAKVAVKGQSSSTAVNLEADSSVDTLNMTGGTGIMLVPTASSDTVVVNHINSVTAVTDASLLKVKYDAQGHITGSTVITKSDITGLGIPGSDTDTKNTAGNSTSNSTVYLAGPTSTSSGASSYAQTYTNASVYMSSGKLYSDKKVVLNSTDLTNINSSIDRLDTSVNILIDSSLKVLDVSCNLTEGYMMDIPGSAADAAAFFGITTTELLNLKNGYYDEIRINRWSRNIMTGEYAIVEQMRGRLFDRANMNGIDSDLSGVLQGESPYLVAKYDANARNYGATTYYNFSVKPGLTTSYAYIFEPIAGQKTSVDNIYTISYGDPSAFYKVSMAALSNFNEGNIYRTAKVSYNSKDYFLQSPSFEQFPAGIKQKMYYTSIDPSNNKLYWICGTVNGNPMSESVATNWTDGTIDIPDITALDASFTATGNNAIVGIGQVDGKITTVKYDTFAKQSDIPDLTNYVTTAQYNGNMPNNFSGVYVWPTASSAANASINVSPDSSKDVLTLKAGTNVTLAGDTTNDIITINATNTTYSAGDGININANNQISAAANIKVKVGDSSFLVPIGGNNPGILDISAGPNVTITPDVNAKRITVAASGFVQGDGISIIKAITQSAYEALSPKDPSTVYIVTADLN